MAKVFIEETTLTAIGDAIRGKTGKTDLIDPANMSTEITNIPAGGGSDDLEPLVLRGDCERACSGPVAAAFIENFPTKISTDWVTVAKSMFINYKLSSVPFDINFSTTSSYHELNSMFNSADKLKSLPKLLNAKPSVLSSLFYGCTNLRSIPQGFTSTWDWSYLDSRTGPYSYTSNSMFSACQSLRTVPLELLEHANPEVGYSGSIFSNAFGSCSTLDEVVGLPIPYPYSTIWTGNAFSQIVYNCNRLKRFTFSLDPETNQPYKRQWKSQTLDLSRGVGVASEVSYITGYSSGITSDKMVKDDATYQALKDDPDWFTTDIAYCRYNHDSAVETINSLPDTSEYLASAGGTNTIKFKGAAGEKTDGGAINTLTEEEIAVATAKGWTVSLT